MILRRLLVLMALLLLAQGVTPAQELDADTTMQGELRAAMREHYQKRLRAELGLSDEQVDKIVARVNEVEQQRNSARRERTMTNRQLQRAMRDGAADAELLRLLERLDQLEVQEQELERSLRAEVDPLLSVRQRVKFRYFQRAFRREMMKQIEQMRGGEMRRNRMGGDSP